MMTFKAICLYRQRKMGDFVRMSQKMYLRG
jgi:hypothetical protein